MAVAATGLVLLGLGRVGDQGLGGEHHGGNRRGEGQCADHHLGGVDDTALDEVGVLTGAGVEALVAGQLTHVLRDRGSVEATVLGDDAQRLLDGAPDDPGPGGGIALEPESIDGGGGAQKRNPTTDDVAVLESRADRGQGVLDARLALLQLCLGGGADADHTDAADEVGKSLLELLAVPVRLDLLDLATKVLGARIHGGAIASTLEDGGVFLGDHHALGAAQLVEADGVQAQAHLLGDQRGTGQYGDVGEDGCAPVTERGGLHGDGRECTTHSVHHQGCQSLGLHVLGEDQQRPSRLHDQLQGREQVGDRGDLDIRDKNSRVVKHRLHRLLVGDQVRRYIAAIELHPLDDLDLGVDAGALLDGHDTLAADALEGLRDHGADELVAGADDRHPLEVLVAGHGV